MWKILLVIFSIIILNILCIIVDNNIKEELIINTVGSMENKKYDYIPRKIFQLIRDKNDVHPKFQKNIKDIRETNPSWEYVLMDDADIIEYLRKNFDPEILHIYNRINPSYGAAKADFFRYLLMYKEGGAYFDIKSSTKVPLDRILRKDDRYILSHWESTPQIEYTNNKYGEFQQWHIICSPGHPYLKAVINKVIKNIENYDHKKKLNGKLGVLKVTGPIAYTKAIIPILDNDLHRIFRQNEYIGLIYDNTETMFGDHSTLFSKTHYSKIKTDIILPKKSYNI
jgi:hypothetical protein